MRKKLLFFFYRLIPFRKKWFKLKHGKTTMWISYTDWKADVEHTERLQQEYWKWWMTEQIK